MEKKILRTNARLEENLRLQNSYRELINKILLACELVDEKMLGIARNSFELLCSVRPVKAYEKTNAGIVEVPIDDFKIVVFVVYAVEIGSTTFSTVRCLVEQDGALVGGCDGDWTGRKDNPRWGKLGIYLPGSRQVEFDFFVGDSRTMSASASVGDYREVFNVTILRDMSMKERMEYLQNLSSKLGLT